MGSADRVAGGINELFDAGVDVLCLRLNFSFVEQSDVHEQLRRLRDEVAPHLRDALPSLQAPRPTTLPDPV